MHGKKKRIVRIFSFSKQQQRFDELNEFLIVRYVYWGKKERKKKELIRLFVSYTNRETEFSPSIHLYEYLPNYESQFFHGRKIRWDRNRARERERDGKIDMADWWSRDGRMVDPIGPRFDVNDSISR